MKGCATKPRPCCSGTGLCENKNHDSTDHSLAQNEKRGRALHSRMLTLGLGASGLVIGDGLGLGVISRCGVLGIGWIHFLLTAKTKERAKSKSGPL